MPVKKPYNKLAIAAFVLPFILAIAVGALVLASVGLGWDQRAPLFIIILGVYWIMPLINAVSTILAILSIFPTIRKQERGLTLAILTIVINVPTFIFLISTLIIHGGEPLMA